MTSPIKPQIHLPIRPLILHLIIWVCLVPVFLLILVPSLRIEPVNQNTTCECRLDSVDQHYWWSHVATIKKGIRSETAMGRCQDKEFRQSCQLAKGYVYMRGDIFGSARFLSYLLRVFLVSHLFTDIVVFMIGLYTFFRYKKSSLSKNRIRFAIVSTILLIAVIALLVYVEQRLYPWGPCFGLSCPVDFHYDWLF